MKKINRLFTSLYLIINEAKKTKPILTYFDLLTTDDTSDNITHMTQEKTSRNQEIYKKFKNGESPYKLAVEYNLTAPRVYILIKKEQRKENK